MPAEIGVDVGDDRWLGRLPAVTELCERAVCQALDRAETDLPLERLEVSLLLSDDATVQDLNWRYRGQDKPTNVLSFATLDDPELLLPPEGPILLGDVVVAFETTLREAETEEKTLDAHLTHLVVHGVLHLLGYDHEEPSEAELMEQLERSILASLEIRDPYRERPDD